jgi:hypothetical protein
MSSTRFGRTCYRFALGTLWLTFVAACGGDTVSESSPPGAILESVSRRYIGCIGPTGSDNTFVLSVAEPRDFTTERKRGPIPQKSELPEGAPLPIPPITVTSGTPGGGPTATTHIVTYTLVGDGGRNLRELIGHTVEVLGSPSNENDAQRGSRQSVDSLYVTSLRDLADYCK